MKLHSIQALRGVAVLLVFLYHVSSMESAALAASGSAESALVAGIWTNGYAGVDLFFVISGFIMVFVTGLVSPSAKTSGAFLFARVARIYPLWWVFAALSAVGFMLTTGTPTNAERLAASGVSEGQHIVSSFLLLPHPVYPILSVGWTLIHEIYFYVVFAALLMMPQRYLPGLLAVWAVIVAAGAYAGLAGPVATNLLTLIFHPMTLEFILGAFAGLLIVNGRRWRPGLIALVGTVWMIAALTFQGDNDAVMLEWGRVVWFAMPCALLVYGFASLDIAGRIKLPSALVDLGDWSYAFYLSHMLTLKALETLSPMAADALESSSLDAPFLTSMLRIGSPGLADNLFFFIAGLMLAIIVSWIAYRFVEKPLLRLLGKTRSALFASSSEQLRPRPIRAAIW